MARKNVEKALNNRVMTLAAQDGYFPLKGYICAKDFAENTRCYLMSYLYDRKPPYAVFAQMACEYLATTQIMKDFCQTNKIHTDLPLQVGIQSNLEYYTTHKTVQRVSDENIDPVADELYERFKEGVEKYIKPRINQAHVVEEYLTLRHWKWPVSTVYQCCITVVSFGLLKKEPAIMKKGIAKAFEILDKPNYSQVGRDFIESLGNAIDKQF
jgi:hypothetical protein